MSKSVTTDEEKTMMEQLVKKISKSFWLCNFNFNRECVSLLNGTSLKNFCSSRFGKKVLIEAFKCKLRHTNMFKYFRFLLLD